MAVPDRLVERVGQRELKVSLRTSSAKAATLIGRTISNLIDVLFEGLPRMPQMTSVQIRDRVRAYFQASLNKTLELSLDLPADPMIDVANEIAMLKEYAHELRSGLALQTYQSPVPIEAEELLSSLDKPPPKADIDAFRLAANGIMRAKIENARILAAMLAGDYASTVPLDPLFAGMQPTGLPPIPGEKAIEPAQPKTLAEVGALYLQFHAKTWAKKTEADQRRVLALAVAVIGSNKAMSSINIEDVKAVRDALAKLPPNYMKHAANKGVTVIQAITANKAGASLSLKTQDKYFAMFRSLLIWSRNEGYADSVPGAGVKVAGVGKGAEQRCMRPLSTRFFRSASPLVDVAATSAASSER
jgi:hypothetical protein